MGNRFGLKWRISAAPTYRIDRFLCGKTLMKKTYWAKGRRGYGSRNREKPVKIYSLESQGGELGKMAEFGLLHRSWKPKTVKGPGVQIPLFPQFCLLGGMVDTYVLGTYVLWRVGSSPTGGTTRCLLTRGLSRLIVVQVIAGSNPARHTIGE